MHTGKDTSVDRETRSLGQKVVISATEHIPAGRNVTTDNFFTSLPLIRELLRRNLTLLGTIRFHRREILKEVRKPENRELCSSKFIFNITSNIFFGTKECTEKIVIYNSTILIFVIAFLFNQSNCHQIHSVYKQSEDKGLNLSNEMNQKLNMK